MPARQLSPLASDGKASVSTPFRLLLPRALLEEMIAQARTELPNECCGFLAGRLPADGDGFVRIERRYPLVNAEKSAVRYESEAKSLIEADVDRRRRGLEFVAVYHSHPTSAPIPSRTDLERNYWPGLVNFIISLMADEPQVRAWFLSENTFSAAEPQVLEVET